MHRKGKAYYLVTWNKKQKRSVWTPLGSDYEAAVLKYSQIMPPAIMPGTTFAELAAEYLKAEFYKLRPATQESYTLALNKLLTAFGSARVREIKPAHVGRYMDLRSAKSAANTEKALLSKILGLGIRWGWCEDNVARKIAYHPTKRRRRIISPLEWKKIQLASTSDLIPVFMDLAFMTGLRVGDLLRLQWKQVGDDGLRVLQGKNNVEGLYELTESLRLVLARARRLHGRSGTVSSLLRPETNIIHKRNLGTYTYSGFRTIWKKTIDRAGLENIHIHDIRRTAITAAKQTGIRPIEFSLHKTEAEANAYVIEVPRVRPLEPMK